MFVQVMNLAMNAAILRAPANGRERTPSPRRPRRVKAPEPAPVSTAPATYQIYAAAFNTAVHGR